MLLFCMALNKKQRKYFIWKQNNCLYLQIVRERKKMAYDILRLMKKPAKNMVGGGINLPLYVYGMIWTWYIGFANLRNEKEALISLQCDYRTHLYHHLCQYRSKSKHSSALGRSGLSQRISRLEPAAACPCPLHFDKKLCLPRMDSSSQHKPLNGYLENGCATSMPEAKRWCSRLRRKNNSSQTDHSCHCYLSDGTNWICLPSVACWSSKQRISGSTYQSCQSKSV